MRTRVGEVAPAAVRAEASDCSDHDEALSVYSHCIFCSAFLGTNEVFSSCPVGRTLAFDAERGRLWIVCPRCARWNLTPLTERWETLEHARRTFETATLRVGEHGIGLASTTDGTQLIRVGDAPPTAIAAWRYGTALRRRRRANLIELTASMLLNLVGPVPTPAQIDRKAVVWNGAADDEPGAPPLVLSRRDLRRVSFHHDDDAGALHAIIHTPWRPFRRRGQRRLEGEAARLVLQRMLVSVNHANASPRQLQEALALLEAAGSADAIVRTLAAPDPETATGLLLAERLRTGIWRGRWLRADGRSVRRASAARMLALEMALHDDAERAAVAGELRYLRWCWQDAESIAAIADSL
jgi:hypothetical protein